MKRKREYWRQLCDEAREEYGIQFRLAHAKVLLPQHLVNTVLNQETGPDVRSDVMRQLIRDELAGIEQQEGVEDDHELSQTSETRFTEEEAR